MRVFCKKSGKWELFFVKQNWKMGGGFVKKSGPFLDAGCIMYSISIFYYTFYLFGGVYAPQPLPTGAPSLRLRSKTTSADCG